MKRYAKVNNQEYPLFSLIDLGDGTHQLGYWSPKPGSTRQYVTRYVEGKLKRTTLPDREILEVL